MLGVLVCEGDESLVGAPVGHDPLLPRCELGYSLEVRRGEREHHPARPLLGAHVMSHQEHAQDLVVAGTGQVLEEALLPGEDLAPPQAQNHAHRIVPVTRKPDGVGVASGDCLNRLRLLQLLEPLQCIPDARGTFEVEMAGGFLHPFPEPRPDLHRLALQERQHIVDHGAVCFPTLIAHARREAAVDDAQRATQHAHVRVRPEEARPREVESPGNEHTGERLTQRDGDAGIALVVPPHHVEARAVLLDQVVLEEQRL